MADRNERRCRARCRDILGTLALAGAIFVLILALPLGTVHAHAYRLVSHLAGRAVPCGLSELSITIDTDRHPFVSIALIPRKLPISL